MSDLTLRETTKTRRLVAAVALMALLLASLAALQTACGKKTEKPAASQQAAAPPALTPTLDAGEPPSFKETAAVGEGPFSSVKTPFEADFDDRGRIWILDSANSRLRLFDSGGGFFGGWGGNGDGKLFFNHPEGLATSRDNLYVADTWNHRVVRFSLAGEWKGSVTGFMGPRGVAVGRDGSVWVADTGNSRVVKYDAALQNPQTVGAVGTKPGEFKGPVSIAVGPSGAVYVTDPGSSRIQVLDKDGKFVSSWSLPWLEKSWQAHLEVDQDETLYISNPEGSEVVSFIGSGKPDRRWTADSSGERFLRPIGLAVGRKQGILYVMDTASHKVLKINLPARKSS